MRLDGVITAETGRRALVALRPAVDRLFDLAGRKIVALDRAWDVSRGTPVFTAGGAYTTRGWTEWTQGFQYGMAVLQFDATGEAAFLELGRARTLERMAPHVSHVGVHDHGFNNVSTYGQLRRLMREGRIPFDGREMQLYELALKVSGAVQAARWTAVPSDPDGRPAERDGGYIHSFNGPHSLFADTVRSVRSLMLAWQLGHVLMAENDRPVSLLGRGIAHCLTTARHNVFYGKGRDAWDVPAERGRVVHESIFNVTDGRYRCPSTQQGYSPFSTWTRGLAWVLLGFAEQLEFLLTVKDVEFMRLGLDPERVTAACEEAATAAADWWLGHSFDDGMVYWDAGAPGIARGETYGRVADPYTEPEPIDSSAAAIAGQGFWRLANYLEKLAPARAGKYRAAALGIAKTLFAEPYLSTAEGHEGLILHSVYHRPNGWDYVPAGRGIPCGESSLWGDYHAMELGLLLKRAGDGAAGGGRYVTFFDT